MRKLYSDNKCLLILYLLIFLSGIIVSSVFGRTGTHLFINGFHSEILDSLMKILTFFGDGIVMISLTVLLMFKKIRYGLIFLSSFLLSSFIVQFFKKCVFTGFTRPVKYFQDTGIELYLVEGVKYHSYFSFPSGHSATAFAMFFGLSFLLRTKLLKLLCLLFACIVGFTRVYLSQHFLIDVIVGSLIGVICAVASHLYFSGVEKNWINLPVFKVFARP